MDSLFALDGVGLAKLVGRGKARLCLSLSLRRASGQLQSEGDGRLQEPGFRSEIVARSLEAAPVDPACVDLGGDGVGQLDLASSGTCIVATIVPPVWA